MPAFHGGHRASYRKDAMEDAWNQTQSWFRKNGVLS
jgi:carboxymethylenebutenolidase